MALAEIRQILGQRDRNLDHDASICERYLRRVSALLAGTLRRHACHGVSLCSRQPVIFSERFVGYVRLSKRP